MCPFAECGQSFSRSGDLVAHFNVEVGGLLTQSDARPYGCPHCPRAFRMAYLLNRHLRACPAARLQSGLQGI